MPTFADWNLLDCAQCRLDTKGVPLNQTVPFQCDHCGKRVAVQIFPAILQEKPMSAVEDTTVIGEESTCFYHANKKATVVCDACGRFLCSLCDVEYNGRHLCSGCIESASTKKDRPGSATRHVRYDSMALTWAAGGLLLGFMSFFFLSVIAAPIALYYVVRYWRAPLSIVQGSRWRFVAAALLALLQLTGFALAIISIAGA